MHSSINLAGAADVDEAIGLGGKLVFNKVAFARVIAEPKIEVMGTGMS